MTNETENIFKIEKKLTRIYIMDKGKKQSAKQKEDN
jgi:hypothetical protein